MSLYVTGQVQFFHGPYPHVGVWLNSSLSEDRICGREDLVVYTLAKQHTLSCNFWRIKIDQKRVAYPRDVVIDIRNPQNPTAYICPENEDGYLGRFIHRNVLSLMDISRIKRPYSQVFWVGTSAWFIGDNVPNVLDLLATHISKGMWRDAQIVHNKRTIANSLIANI